MDAEIVNVGNGACSILSDSRSTMVVDCGSSSRGRPEYSSRQLRNAMGARVTQIDTVVITHFDADHWKGIYDYPSRFSGTQKPSHVTLHYPYLLPQDAGLIQLAFMVMDWRTTRMPITAASDILDVWRLAGVAVDPQPLVRGRVFHTAGKDWTVHWPPSSLESFADQTQASFRSLARLIRALAGVHRGFRHALNIIQDGWLRVLQESERERDNDRPANDPDDYDADDVRRARNVMDKPGGWDAFAARLHSFNNMLSVVHTTDTFANFGDCDGAGMTALLNQRGGSGPQLADDYPVILAPHHGTHSPRPTVISAFPSAVDALVSQNGPRHYKRGRKGEAKAFKDGVVKKHGARLVDTYKSGKVTFAGL